MRVMCLRKVGVEGDSRLPAASFEIGCGSGAWWGGQREVELGSLMTRRRPDRGMVTIVRLCTNRRV